MLRTCRLLRCARSPEAVLGLKPGTAYSSKEIKEAFQAKARTAHPDAGGSNEEFRTVRAAYETLRSNGHKSTPGATNDCSHSAPPREDANARKDRYSGPGDGTYTSAGWASTGSSYHGYSGDGPYSSEDTRRGSTYGRRREGTQWDYGNGKHYANYSTRDFYRPYESDFRSPGGSGFTTQEIREAKIRQRLYIAWTLFYYCVMLYLLGIAVGFMYRYTNLWRTRNGLYQLRRGDIIEEIEYGYEEPPSRLERLRTERRLRAHTPAMQEHWSEVQKDAYIRRWNDDFKERERRARNGSGDGGFGRGGGSSPPGVTRVISYQGRPFSPSGVHRMTHESKNTNERTAKQNDLPEVCVELDDADSGVRDA